MLTMSNLIVGGEKAKVNNFLRRTGLNIVAGMRRNEMR